MTWRQRSADLEELKCPTFGEPKARFGPARGRSMQVSQLVWVAHDVDRDDPAVLDLQRGGL